MTHGHASQEGEHASHHSHDPFDRKVAMSMVVIAAILALVKIIAHRAHNDTLAYQIKSGVQHTQESDAWNFFQSKKLREVQARFEAEMILQEAKRGAAPKGDASKGDAIDWTKTLAKLQADFEEVIAPPENTAKNDPPEKTAAKIVEDMKAREAKLAADGVPADAARRVVLKETESRRYNQESRYIMEKAAKLKKKADEYQAESKKQHKKADWFDMGELGVELALVLSSVAILTKRGMYWAMGIGVGLLGLIAVGVGLVVT